MHHFLCALIALLVFVEATVPARAFPVATTLLDVPSTETSGAFILVKKGKGHGDGEERFERHRRHEAYRSSRHRRHSGGNQGFGNHSGFAGGNQNQPNGQN